MSARGPWPYPAAVANLLNAFGQHDPNRQLLVFDSLHLLRPLQERHVHDITSGGSSPNEVLGVRVPADSKWILPAAKHGIPWLDLEQSLLLVATEAGRGDIANDVGIVNVGAAYPERELHLPERVRRGVVVLRLRPLDPVEEARQVRPAVVEGVALLKGNISTPVADLDVSFQLRDVVHGLGELEPHFDRLCCTGRLLFERPISELGALLLRNLLCVAASWQFGIVRNVARRELDLGLLLGSDIGRGAIGREAVDEELVLVLGDGGREGSICAEVIVGDAEGLLSASSERAWQPDPVVLGGTFRC